ncbi:hypothetical protein CGCVW01_v008845 [Colletotrichum viniferum]|nr:hypothetical protein CGCVW01_v008845 [Colletotrichum viniferum]
MERHLGYFYVPHAFVRACASLMPIAGQTGGTTARVFSKCIPNRYGITASVDDEVTTAQSNKPGSVATSNRPHASSDLMPSLPLCTVSSVRGKVTASQRCTAHTIRSLVQVQCSTNKGHAAEEIAF